MISIPACVKSGVGGEEDVFVCLLVFVCILSGKTEEVDSMLSPGRNLDSWQKYVFYRTVFPALPVPSSHQGKIGALGRTRGKAWAWVWGGGDTQPQ